MCDVNHGQQMGGWGVQPEQAEIQGPMKVRVPREPSSGVQQEISCGDKRSTSAGAGHSCSGQRKERREIRCQNNVCAVKEVMFQFLKHH